MNDEEWRDVPGHEGCYQASNLGRIRRLPRRTAGAAWQTNGRLLPARLVGRSVDNKGYHRIHISLDDRSTHPTHPVSHLVALTWIGPKPAGAVVVHLDGDPGNDAAANLAYRQPGEINRNTPLKVGLERMYTKPGGLRADQVREMRRRYDAGETTQAKLADEFGVSPATVHRVVRRITFYWLKDEE